MNFSLLPSLVAECVTDLTPELLQSQGIRLLMLDFDNTIVPYTTDKPTQTMSRWLQNMQQSEIQICVVSNSHRDRVKKFCQDRGIACITHASKPFPGGIRRCLAQYGFPAAQCALAGDQIFTDTLGGNCAGIRSILVKPIHNHNFWLKARHVLELPFIYMARKRRLMPGGKSETPEKNL